MEYFQESQYAELVRYVETVARHEDVGVVVSSTDVKDCSRRLRHLPRTEIVERDHCNLWLRDVGPSFLRTDPLETYRGAREGLMAISWDWHGYGSPYGQAGEGEHSRGRRKFYENYYCGQWEDACEIDIGLAEGIARDAAVENVVEPGLAFEGGAIVTDGEGTGVVVEEMLPRMGAGLAGLSADFEDVKRRLLKATGLRKILWLPNGLSQAGNAHADMVCAFVGPARLLVVEGVDRRLKANLRALEGATDALGRKIEVVRVPSMEPGLFEVVQALAYTAAGRAFPLEARSYTNVVFVEGAVLVPAFGDKESDDAAVAALRKAVAAAADALGHREVVKVPLREVSRLGGGLRCLSLPVPRLY